jgi:hypothetical protein
MDEFVETVMMPRINRMNLDTTKTYIKVQKKDGALVEEEVGLFVKSYRMGSGDGMTIHWEFLKDNVIVRIDDEMWGSISGAELIGFKEKI